MTTYYAVPSGDMAILASIRNIASAAQELSAMTEESLLRVMRMADFAGEDIIVKVGDASGTLRNLEKSLAFIEHHRMGHTCGEGKR